MLLRLGALSAAPVRLPLDGLAGVAAAYGVRRLVSGYAGSCLRLRRSSDNAEADFGFGPSALNAGAIDAWLGGAAGYVTKWYDQSGNGRHAVQTAAASQPVIEPANAFKGCLPITCDGVAHATRATKSLAIPASVSISRANSSVFCVINPITSLQKNIHWEFGSGASIHNVFTDPESGGIGFHHYDGGGTTRVWNTLAPPAQPLVEGVVAGASDMTAYLNGQSQSLSASGATATAGGSIGGTAFAGFEGRSDYFALVVISAALSPAKASELSSALRRSFAIDSGQAAQLLLDGDSITEGFGATRLRNNARQIETLLSKPVLLRNLGIYGQTLAAMNANKANVTGRYDPTKAANICLTAGGSNDLVFNNVAASTVYGSLTSYTSTLKAAGFKVVWATVLPRNDGDSGDHARVAAYNQLLRDNWAASADGLADYAAHPTIGPQAAAANALYYPDGVHPSTLTYGIMAGIAAPAINGLL